MKRIAIALITFLLLTSLASAATLNVGPHEKYKTIQSAVNAAHNDDTIKVAYGTYKETVKTDKSLTILGTKYPKVNGFYYWDGASGTINGFSIQKNGVEAWYAGGSGCIIRNNYFYNCGIAFAGAGNVLIKNNQIKNGLIYLHDSYDNIITGNIISKSYYGLYLGDSSTVQKVSGNTFQYCTYGVYLYGYDQNPGQLPAFTGNKYLKNKVNIGWGYES